MVKLAIRLVAAVFTYVIGSLIVMIWPVNHSQVTAVVPPPILQAVNQQVRSLPDEAWLKVAVNRRFSFYIPQYLQYDGSPFNSQLSGNFHRSNFEMNGLFNLYYESRKASTCNGNITSRYKATTNSEILINGKKASVITMIPDEHENISIFDFPYMEVCFPDIGHGQKLKMRFNSVNTVGLDVAKQIIKTIEFQ